MEVSSLEPPWASVSAEVLDACWWSSLLPNCCPRCPCNGLAPAAHGDRAVGLLPATFCFHDGQPPSLLLPEADSAHRISYPYLECLRTQDT